MPRSGVYCLGLYWIDAKAWGVVCVAHCAFAGAQHRNDFCAPKRKPKPLRGGGEQVHLQIRVALLDSIGKASLSTSLLLAVCNGLISTEQ